jgi:5-methylcytosine-specific restriction endonuclease McrA
MDTMKTIVEAVRQRQKERKILIESYRTGNNPFDKGRADKERDYKEEYKNYHSKPEQVKNRGARNKARRELGLKKGDPREADHINPLSKGGSNTKKNLRAVSRETNRRKGNK